MMYGEFNNWMNMYGKDITVGKSNKTLHSVLARWTSKDDDKSRKTVESKCNGSKEEEEEGYCLVWATELLLAAIGLVFPALVLGYKSFNVSCTSSYVD